MEDPLFLWLDDAPEIAEFEDELLSTPLLAPSIPTIVHSGLFLRLPKFVDRFTKYWNKTKTSFFARTSRVCGDWDLRHS